MHELNQNLHIYRSNSGALSHKRIRERVALACARPAERRERSDAQQREAWKVVHWNEADVLARAHYYCMQEALSTVKAWTAHPTKETADLMGTIGGFVEKMRGGETFCLPGGLLKTLR